MGIITDKTENTPAFSIVARHQKPKTAEICYSGSAGLPSLLRQLNISIAATSYQSNRLYLLGQNSKGGLNVDQQFFRKAMGLNFQGEALTLVTLDAIYRLENVLRADQVMGNTFTHCYLPRTAHFTGMLDAHDVGITNQNDIMFVNTRYNCIAAISNVHSFKLVWKPTFISEIIAEDRCHLNGMAMQDGELRYVTAVSKTDIIDGWRGHRVDGGVVIDVEKNEIICEGLSMPHSPRIHGDRLWLLNSGTGELGWVEPKTNRRAGKFNPVCFCPGFVRGLSFYDHYAIVGLSRPRTGWFKDFKLLKTLTETQREAWCGVQIIDLNTGECAQWFRIDGKIGEIYDVAVLPNVPCAKSISFSTNEATNAITVED